MIPILYEKTEVDFVTNGICRLHDMISAEVVEERNGVYELDFQYPVDGANFDKLECGRIVGVIHDDTKTIQPFDIVSYTRPINGIVSFHCVHISYRLTGFTVATRNIASLQEATTLLGSIASPFYFSSDFTSSGYLAVANGIPRSIRQFIGGTEGSMLDTYGGEIEWDKFNVIFHKNRGELKDFNIRYGVNMVDYEDSVDFSDTYNRCLPYWASGDSVVYGNIVSSGYPSFTGQNICVPLDLSDKFETAPTSAELETMGVEYMQDNQTHLPRQTIKVDFVRLQDVGEYEQLESLLECNLCDTIGVIFPKYGMQGTFKIVRTVYDVLGERFTEMELGALSVTLSEALGISSGSSSSASNNAEDYIIEQGTSGIWKYRKWNNGTCELWAREDIGSIAITTARGGVCYSSAISKDLPFTVYGAVPSVSAGTTSTAVHNTWAGNVKVNNGTTLYFYLFSPDSITMTMNVMAYYIIGRWEQ